MCIVSYMPICLINLGQGQTSVMFRNTVLYVCRDLLKLTYWFIKVSSDSELAYPRKFCGSINTSGIV